MNDVEKYITNEELVILARRTDRAFQKAFNQLSIALVNEDVHVQFVRIATYISAMKVVSLIEQELLDTVPEHLMAGFKELSKLEPMRLAKTMDEVHQAIGLPEGVKA